MAKPQSSEYVESQLLNKKLRSVKVNCSFQKDQMRKIIAFRRREGISTDQEVIRIAVARLTFGIELPE